MKNKNKFGWTNPQTKHVLDTINNSAALREQIETEITIREILNEQNIIYNTYINQTIFFTPRAGLYNRWYRNMDFEVVDIQFRNPQYPRLPTFVLVHVRDDPRNPNNIIHIDFPVRNFNMIRGGR